jgi:tetratricopeptide (TPR) repeat protein
MTFRCCMRVLILALPTVFCASVRALPQQSASASDSELGRPSAARPAAGPNFGKVFAFPVSSKSVEAQKLVELALDQYENVLLDRSVDNARKATEKDPGFALAYAVWSFAARRTQPNPQAARKAELLAGKAPADERLLVKFLTAVEKEDMLPAISAMNDLLARFPEDRHALYLTSEWLYFEQDYDRSLQMMEKIIKLDPSFAPAYNMLGYSMVEAGRPDPAKAIAYLKKYAELERDQPNPEDSLGEVSRYAGDDKGSLHHYRAALKIEPRFITSQTGLGDTYTLMGDFAKANQEYDKAAAMAAGPRDRLHVEFQKCLAKFWQNRGADGLKQLAIAEKHATEQHEPYSQFEIGEALALFQPTAAAQLEKLAQLELLFSKTIDGMSAADRNASLASIWRDEVRIAAEELRVEFAQDRLHRLEALATKSRDLLVSNCYESSRGYLLFAQKDFSGAAEQLAADPHSPVAFTWLARARENAGDKTGAEAALLRFKYLRAPTTEWYLASHPQNTAVH